MYHLDQKLLQEGCEMGERSEALDIGRGLASSYVVWHHVQSGLFGAGIFTEILLNQIDYIAGVWRMPFFFFVAGIFLPRVRPGVRTFGRFLSERASTVLWPFLVWMTIQNVVILLLPNYVNYPMTIEHLLYSLIFPPGQFWFLQMLLLVSFVLALLDWKAPRTLPFVAVVGIAASALLIHDRMSFEYRITMGLGWGALGVFLGRTTLERLVRGAPVLPLGLVGAAALASGWWTVSWWTGMLLISTIGGFLLVFWAGRMLEGGRVGRMIAMIGRNSLKVYLLHLFFCAGTRIALIRLFGINDPYVHAVAGLFAGTFGVVLLAHWLEGRGIYWPFRFPFPVRVRSEK